LYGTGFNSRIVEWWQRPPIFVPLYFFGTNGYQKTVNSLSDLMVEIERIVEYHGKVTELKDVISEVLSW